MRELTEPLLKAERVQRSRAARARVLCARQDATEATRRAVLRLYPRPGQCAQRAAVRGRKHSLVRRYAGTDLKTRLGPGMIPPSKKSRTVPVLPRFGEGTAVNKP